MAKRKSNANEVNLDSFLDIMTCLVGVLVLIIILTGIDAAQIKVLINTPMQYRSDKRPLFIECRNNELFMIPLDELNERADETLNEITKEEFTNPREIYKKAMVNQKARNEHYIIDLVYSLIGLTALTPIGATSGYPLAEKYERGAGGEPADGWFQRLLDGFDKDDQMLSFLVRDDSFRVFKLARALAWMERIDVSYELLASGEQIRFGVGGGYSGPQ